MNSSFEDMVQVKVNFKSRIIMQEIDIGILSLQTGVSTATIRFYESKGLIKSIGRKDLRRQYLKHTVETLLLIKLLKNGLSSREIDEVSIYQSKVNIDRSLINEKIEQIENLKKSQIILKHLKSCPYKEHLSCPEFINMLNSSDKNF